LLHLGDGHFDGSRAPTAGSALHEPAAVGDDAHRIGEPQRPGDVRGRHLAEAVADHGIGDDAPGLPQTRQRHLQREQNRLGHLGLLQPRVGLVRHQLIEQRPVDELPEQLIALLDRCPEDRLLRQQLPAHPEPLRPLS